MIPAACLAGLLAAVLPAAPALADRPPNIPWDLDDSETYSRIKCNTAGARPSTLATSRRTEALPGISLNGHQHDWEHLISWVSQDSGQIEYVSTTPHSGQKTYPRSQVLCEGTHPKVICHEDGASTHVFRLANTHDDSPENSYHIWQHPPIIGYYYSSPSEPLRDELMTADFGSATIKINDSRFESLLNAAKLAGIPFNPYG